MYRLSVLIFLIGAFVSLALAASAPTFCKCTCFTNSTIIEIKPKGPTSGTPPASQPQKQQQPPADNPDTTVAGPADTAAQDAISGEAAERNNENESIKKPLARRAQGASPSCSQCNRSFCLSQSLPICKGAADKDVVTMCFQRDSRKDQIIVWGFILGTAGLLGWAAVQKAVDLGQKGRVPGLGGGGGGRPPRTVDGGGVSPLGRGPLGSTGAHAARGAYATVAGHSRESSLQTS